MSEASLLDLDGKQAVATVIVNRVLSEEFPNTVREVIEEPNQFSTADNGRPDFECYLAVTYAITSESFPTDMYWFRTDYPHSWGYHYATFGNTYFSTQGDHENGNDFRVENSL